jgi:ABC-2 type transport system permease protein
MNISRLRHILKKEFIQFFSDKRLVAQILIAPILQLILFGYVVSTDVKNINTIVYDQDKSIQSRGMIKKFSSSGYFRIKEYAGSIEDIKQALDNNSASVALNIPPDFSRLLAAGRSASMQIIVDGTNSNNAGIALNYAQRIIQDRSKDVILEKLSAANGGFGSFKLPDPSIRVWFNPELKSVYYMVPGLVAMLLTIITMLLTSVAIVKEREQGTDRKSVV